MKKKNKDKATGVLFLADGSIKEIIFNTSSICNSDSDTNSDT